MGRRFVRKRGPKFGGPCGPFGAEVPGAIRWKIGRSRAARRICDFPGNSGCSEIRLFGFRRKFVGWGMQFLGATLFDAALSRFSGVQRKTGIEIRGSRSANRGRGVGWIFVHAKAGFGQPGGCASTSAEIWKSGNSDFGLSVTICSGEVRSCGAAFPGIAVGCFGGAFWLK